MITKKIEISDEITCNDLVVRKNPFRPTVLSFVMDDHRNEGKRIWQDLYKEDVEALIQFLQENMPEGNDDE